METLIRRVIFRAMPISPDERQAFETFNKLLNAKLKDVENDLLSSGTPITKVMELRELLDKIPGLWT